jgi:phosphohistidine phosphatase
VDLFILRHGKAEPAGTGTGDADRRLTKKGQDEITIVAAFLASGGYSFDLIATSPLARAKETAAIVAGILGEPEKVEVWPSLLPGGNPDLVCREAGGFLEMNRILLVGHEPLLSLLVGRIIGGDDGAAIVMTKGSLARIRNFSFAHRPSGELQWLVSARHLAGPKH